MRKRLSAAYLALQYNFLNETLPQYDELPKRLLRSAVIGFSASAVSDTCSNSIRVVKTSKQASTVKVTYPEVVRVSSCDTMFQMVLVLLLVALCSHSGRW